MKMLSKNILLDILYFLLSRIPINGVPVLVYHSVGESNSPYVVKTKEFYKQIKWLNNKFNSVSINDIYLWLNNKKKLPPNPIAITFDDGYKDNFTNALPILKTFNFIATVFYSPQYNPKSHLNLPKLDKKSLLSLIKENWDIQAHGLSHSKFTHITSKELKNECVLSNLLITKLTGKKPTMLAYPCGSFSINVINIINKYYQAAWTIKPGFNRQKQNTFTLKRIEVRNNTSLVMFKLHLTLLLEWVKTFYDKEN